MADPSGRARRNLAKLLPVLTALLLAAAVVSGYAWRALFDTDEFADRATAALQSPAVRAEVGERVTDELVLRAAPDLLAARPIVAAAIDGIVGGDAFATLFRRAAADAHRAVFRRDDDTVTLTLVDVGVLAREALQQLRPQLAEQLERDSRLVLLHRDIGSVTGDLTRLAQRIRAIALVLALLALASAAGAVLAARDRREAIARLGVATIWAGAAIVAATVVAKAMFVARVGDGDAARAVWDAFFGDLRTGGWLIAAAGAIVAATAASLIRPIDVEEPLRAAWRIATREPNTTGLRIARGAALVAAGALVIAEPLETLRIVVTLAGVYLLYKGIEALLRLIGPRPEDAGAARRKGWTRRMHWVAAPLVATALIASGAVAFAGGDALDQPAPAPDGCNGREELCDRPLDEVVLPATHNSMSVPLPGWFSSLQDGPIRDQLDDGIRGLLIDTHYADLLPNGRTRTYFTDESKLTRAIEQDGVSPQSVAAARRLRDRAGFSGSGERGMYLCHTFCELGSTPLADTLGDIREFLVTHPAEVVVVINEDYVTPADFTAAVEDAGLGRYMITPPAGGRWPTLRELIDAGTRLMILAENQAGAAPWYQPAFERVVQDTPFTFTRRAQLTDPAALPASCQRNRGPADARLFLVNHWINSDPLPRPSDATVVNARGPLLERARVCERERRRRVSLLAVDFYRRGDLFAVVDELNGLG